ncbi:MAG: hypothetical protein K5864_07190 [Bacteroidales bacterium]|nr:hypothetical protein [Bacteroidales bacterium]
MEANEKTRKAAERFAKSKNLDIVTYVGKFDGYPTYNATSEALKRTIYGFPIYIYVNQTEKGYECRFTTLEETQKIMKRKK